MMRFAARKFEKQIEEAWQDFNISDFPVPFVDRATENQIFMPYFLFHWEPGGRFRGCSPIGKGGVVTRWYMLEKGRKLTEMDRLFLEQATTQPVTFYEVLQSEPGERITVRDILTGMETAVIERTASQTLRRGDLAYGQLWNLPPITIFGCLAPLAIPPDWKAEVIMLRKKLRKKIAKQNRNLNEEDLLRYTNDIRETYLDIRDDLYAPAQFCNTDGDPLDFHTLTFRIDSAEAAFKALAPLAVGRSKESLLDGAEFDQTGKLLSVKFGWLKKGNRKIPSWDNTILGNIKISEHSLVAEANSEHRAARLRAKIEKRLGALAIHQTTVAHTPEEVLKNLPKEKTARAELDEEKILRNPEVRKKLQESVQQQVEDWVNQKIPILGNRTPLEAVRDPDGREIIESLLLKWEQRTEEGMYPSGIRPDISALRKLLNLDSTAAC
jgi:hypothetical protein